MEKKVVDFRVSILPLVDAEKVVMRILDTSGGILTLKELGFRPRSITIMERNITKPYGIFLITGPTGSGKTTTLATAISYHNNEDTTVVTLEDPVEYYMPGVNQSQINPDVGLTFAAGLRAILRQDPDVIMVGEIRDKETGELAIHAGLTGHLVFSTLHTNDALGAIPRLIDMGIQPFLLVAALNMVMAQRLVRRICESCKEEMAIPENLQAEVREGLKDVPSSFVEETFGKPELPWKFYHGKGCKRCGNSGYKGRTTIAEYVEMTEELRKIVLEGNDEKRVVEEFRRQGMITMQQDGLMKVLEGVTTLEEVLSVTKA
jgi:type II secretory ATPase GspE/PulE/Tfp pilus assembly ATPase PilB-like protein